MPAGLVTSMLSLGLAAAFLAACGPESSGSHRARLAVQEPLESAGPGSSRIVVSPRSVALAMFPCSRCHAGFALVEPALPPYGPHHDLVLEHMPTVAVCSQCHDTGDLEKLRLLAGERVSFDRVELLCGQCHPARRHDWELGMHGKQTGSWRAVKYRYACTECHDPHHPRRPAMVAYPAPPFPRLGVREHVAHDVDKEAP